MTVPAESSLSKAEHGFDANGSASLTDRVKGLRLTTSTSVPRSGGSGWLPWLLCLLMAITWASFGVRAYTTGGWRAILGGAAAQPSMGASTEGSKREKPGSLSTTAPGEMVLTVKGYLVAARQIQVG